MHMLCIGWLISVMILTIRVKNLCMVYSCQYHETEQKVEQMLSKYFFFPTQILKQLFVAFSPLWEFNTRKLVATSEIYTNMTPFSGSWKEVSKDSIQPTCLRYRTSQVKASHSSTVRVWPPPTLHSSLYQYHYTKSRTFPTVFLRGRCFNLRTLYKGHDKLRVFTGSSSEDLSTITVRMADRQSKRLKEN